MNSPYDMSSPGGRAGDHADAEQTLRLMAQVPAPDGMEARVKARLREASQAAGRSGGVAILFSPGDWLHKQWVRGFAAAAIVVIVVGSGWGMFSRVEPAQVERVLPAPQVHAGGFSTAGAMRTPQTLQGPVLSHPAAKVTKPGDEEEKGAALKDTKTGKTGQDVRNGIKKQDRTQRERPPRTTEDVTQ